MLLEAPFLPDVDRAAAVALLVTLLIHGLLKKSPKQQTPCKANYQVPSNIPEKAETQARKEKSQIKGERKFQGIKDQDTCLKY